MNSLGSFMLSHMRRWQTSVWRSGGRRSSAKCREGRKLLVSLGVPVFSYCDRRATSSFVRLSRFVISSLLPLYVTYRSILQQDVLLRCLALTEECSQYWFAHR